MDDRADDRSQHLIHVRDPIHGSIQLTPRELAIVEHPACQRLRWVKQLGFADFAFPGATHTRFAHSLGSVQTATRAFDAIFTERGLLRRPARRRFRQAIRLALLLHDVGHPPLSHGTEGCMPPLSALGLEARWLPSLPETGLDATTDSTLATHEDFTVKLVLQSDLAELLRRTFADEGIEPSCVARLIRWRSNHGPSAFVDQGIDYEPLLRQLVSGELDADRMDYLQRDSYYAGVNYGKFDDQWLISNLTCHLVDGDRAHLGLQHRAIFAFEDFLLSRYHMFVSVYYHHTAVGLDAMLARFIDEAPGAFVIPADPAAFVELDDVAFWTALRGSCNRWAQRIVGRQLYHRAVELNADDERLLEAPGLTAELRAAEIDYFVSRDAGVLSRYYGDGLPGDNPIYVVNPALHQATRIESYSKLFARYAQPALLTRLYCPPAQVERARACLRAYVPAQVELDLVP